MHTPFNVFISYSSNDAALCEELRKHLSPLEREGIIRSWHYQQIGPGQDWRAVIHKHLEAAQVILLLVSADFISSDYCHSVELRRALERNQRGQACVIPILIRAVDWRDQEFARLWVLPEDGRPVMSWASRDEAWTSVAKAIRDALTRRNRGATFAPMSANTMMKALRDSGMQEGHVAPTYSQPPAQVSRPPTSTPPFSQPSPHAPRYSAPHPPAQASRPPASMPPFSQPSPHTPRHSATSFIPPPPSRARKSGSARWILLLLAASLSMGALVLVGLSFTERSRGREDPEQQPPTSSRAAPAVSTSLPSGPPRSVPPPALACEAPCCGGSLCPTSAQNIAKLPFCKRGNARCDACPSGRTCVPKACSTPLDPESRWLLRVARADVDGRSHPYPNLELCVRVVGSTSPPMCTRYADMADIDGADPLASMATRIEVTTRDFLLGGGLEILVREGGDVVLEKSRAAHDFVLITALCRGLQFSVRAPAHSPWLSGSGKVLFYLDDP